MVENNYVEEYNNIYCLRKVIKAIVVNLIFFLKIKLQQWWKTVMLKKTTMPNFGRRVIKAIAVINS